MGNICRTFALFLILSMAMSCLALLIVKPANAQTTPIPTIPEFTAKLVDHSYNVPATTTINPYTGEIVNNPAHRVENYTIDLTIKNQPYTPVIAKNGANTSFVYQIQVKGHFAKDWIPMHPFGEGPKMSNTENTVITYVLLSSSTQPDEGYYLTSHDVTLPSTNTIIGLPPKSQIDFQVEALSGYWTRTIEFASQHFEAQESGWSNTQTVTIPEASTSTSPSLNPTPTPTVPELSSLVVIPLTFGVFAIAVIVRHRKSHNSKEKSIN